MTWLEAVKNWVMRATFAAAWYRGGGHPEANQDIGDLIRQTTDIFRQGLEQYLGDFQLAIQAINQNPERWRDPGAMIHLMTEYLNNFQAAIAQTQAIDVMLNGANPQRQVELLDELADIVNEETASEECLRRRELEWFPYPPEVPEGSIVFLTVRRIWEGYCQRADWQMRGLIDPPVPGQLDPNIFGND